MESSLRKKKGATKDPKKQESYSALNNTSSMKASREGKILAMTCNDYKKGMWYGPAKLDNKLPQNIQDIRRSQKRYQENY